MSDSLVNAKTDSSSRDILTVLWYFFISSRWAALLLLVLALTIVSFAVLLSLGNAGLLPVALGQASPSVVEGPNGQAPDGFGGVISLYGSLWVRLLLALLAFTLLLRLADRWDLLFHLRQHISAAQHLYFQKQPLCDEGVHPSLAESDIRKLVRGLPHSRLARVWTVEQKAGVVLYAENLRAALLGDWLLHLGFLVIVAGLFVTAQWAWHEDDIALAAGETYELEHASGYALSLESSPEKLNAGVTTLSLESSGGEIREIDIAPLRPELVSSFAIFLREMGPALRLSVADGTGSSLLLQPFVEGTKPSGSVILKFEKEQSESHLFVPKLGITLRIVRYGSLPEEGFDQPVYLMRAYRGTQPSPLFAQYVAADRTFYWQDLAFAVTLEDYAILNAVQDWGWWFVLGGLLLVLAGSVISRWPAPWLMRFRAEARDDGLCVFEQVTAWGYQDPLGRTEAAIRACWQCVEELEAPAQ